MKKLTVVLIFNFSVVFGCSGDNEEPNDSGMLDIGASDTGFGKDAIQEDSTTDQEVSKDLSPDIPEDIGTDPNSNSSIELEADLNTLKSCDAVCRNVQRECEIVPIFLEMGGCVAEYGPDTFFVLGCDVVPEASHQGIAISRQECKCGPIN